MAVRIDAGRGRRAVGAVSTAPRTQANFGALGQGIQALGRELEQRQREREAEAEDEQRRADAVFVSREVSAARLEFSQQFDDMVAGYDGAEPGFADEVGRRLKEAQATRLEGLSGERQERLNLELEGLRATLIMSAYDSERQGRERYILSGVTDTADQTRNAILSDPAQMWSALEGVETLVEAAPERLQAALASDIRSQYAAAYVDARVAENPHALRQELDEGGLDGLLEPGAKAQALRAADASIARLDREAERVREQQRAYELIALQPLAQDHVASLAASGEGVEGFDEDAYAQMLPVQAAASFTRQVAAARSAYEAVGDFRSLTPAEMAERVEALAPQPGQAGFARRQEDYELAVRAMDQQLTARADPAAYVAGAAPVQEATQALVAAQDSQQIDAIFAAQANLATARLAEQERLGVPPRERRILPAAAAQQVVEDVERAEDPGRAMRDLLDVLTSWGDHQGQVLGELVEAGLDESAAAVAEFSDQPAMAARLARAVTNRRDIEAAVEPSVRREVRERVPDQLEALLDTFSANANGPQIGGQIIRATQDLAMDYAARGASPRDAAEAAAKAFRDRYVIADGYRIPAGRAQERRRVSIPRPPTNSPNDFPEPTVQFVTAEDLIARGADHALIALTRGAGERIADMVAQDLPLLERSRLTADAVAASGQWVTLPDEDGLQLVAEIDGLATPVRDRAGEAIALSWEDLERLGRARMSGRDAVEVYDEMSAQRMGISLQEPGFRP